MRKKIRKTMKENRLFKAIPNTLTLCNSLCGFWAILHCLGTYENEHITPAVFAMSAWVIMFAMVFDALDGFAARLFDASSMHGIQMDSLADMVTFGVAPATVVAILTHKLRGTLPLSQEFFIYLLCSVYLGGAALRLATYNVHAIFEKKSDDIFSGLPSPGAASAICSIVLFAESANIPLHHLAVWLPVYAAVLGLLMVSPFPYMHFGKWLVSLRHKPAQFGWLLALFGVLAIFRAQGLLVLVTLYILSGPMTWVAAILTRNRADSSGTEGE